ncbi:hypothetical protein [Deinococcus soli (ex Cha et al. 2016)]|uniref:Uncharacterized protein n=2 Tax=Deinococcus soli (ex Cha et al. 2016) TaxID=1309411 RepID=A0ACC6KG03_9DEIO|nr:hypothetical protein [Deinococcus soli (ex Cha et al. 2016)]MDR6218392.1 hypothetical protein [Deinococcus soli (ex Cha et al. 2016)]MDR6329132.1 hypothetical protein [Deinococcus soli (ex Cha et al. 2016)]MDR6751405.1 hypothetical protein [Deinococcus soli (ex Cha et al. 2016)]
MRKNLIFEGPCSYTERQEVIARPTHAVMMTETQFCWRGTLYEVFTLAEVGVLLGVIGTQRVDATTMFSALIDIQRDVRAAAEVPTDDRDARGRLDEFEAFLALVRGYVFAAPLH